MERILINILSDNLVESKEFFVNLLDLKVDFDSDWFINLTSEKIKTSIGIFKRNSEFIPKNIKRL